MKGPERPTRHTNTGKITAIKSLSELGGRDDDILIAVIRSRQQIMGDRRYRDIQYPLNTLAEQEMKVGETVRIGWKTRQVGKGSLTTATLDRI